MVTANVNYYSAAKSYDENFTEGLTLNTILFR